MFWDRVAVLGFDEGIYGIDWICGEEGRWGAGVGWVSNIYIGEIDYVRNIASGVTQRCGYYHQLNHSL